MYQKSGTKKQWETTTTTITLPLQLNFVHRLLKMQAPIHPQVKEKPTPVGCFVRVIFSVFLECCTLI
jgi:hypothetical protein